MVLPELEFYLFDDVRYASTMERQSYEVDAEEGSWNSDSEAWGANSGYHLGRAIGQHAAPPRDHLYELRSEIVRALGDCGVPVKYHHHELGGPGQVEIEFRFEAALAAGDHLQVSKDVIKQVALAHGKTATFMPKPLYGEAGSGLHFHQHFFRGDDPVFYDPQGYAGLSELARSYVAGLLDHGPSLLALTNPSTNSFKRLVPGFEAPVNLFYSLANRSAAIRIPKYAVLADEKRVEFRPPDATCNGYLAMAAMLMAGLDGIRRHLDPEKMGFGPIDENIYTWTDAKRATIKPLPDSLSSALRQLRNDHEYLLAGGVFTSDLIDVWIARKTKESAEIQSRPHPHEFAMYYAV
jgi:glutamine synthetase